MQNLLKNITIIIFVSIFIQLFECTSNKPVTRSTILPSSIDALTYYLPIIKDSTKFVMHKAYALEFSSEKEDPLWVAYNLKSSNFSVGERNGTFQPDPQIATASVIDYSHSGYDRGHMAPAADFTANEEAEKETFFMSNICPQEPGFNRGIWKRLEEKIRFWSKQDSSLYVVTGPILNNCIEQIGSDNVCVPEYFWKVVLDYRINHFSAIAFIMKNESSHDELQHFVVPVDSIEKLTGIDFFASLPDSLENCTEKNVDLTSWSLDREEK